MQSCMHLHIHDTCIMHAHTLTHACTVTHACIQTHVHVHAAHTCAHVPTHAFTHMHAHAHTHYTHAHTRTHICTTYAYTHTHAHIHTHACIYMHSHIHACAHTHGHTQRRWAERVRLGSPSSSHVGRSEAGRWLPAVAWPLSQRTQRGSGDLDIWGPRNVLGSFWAFHILSCFLGNNWKKSPFSHFWRLI